MDSRVRFGALMALFISMLVGCSGGESRPDTVPVSGTITFEGKPLEGATVSFVGQGASQAAIGTTDSAGKYQLTMFEEDDGAVIGSHIVSVLMVDASADADVENPDASYEELMGGGGSAEKEGGFPGRTDLTAEVKAGEPNEFNFDL